MTGRNPGAWGTPPGSAVIRARREDFLVDEQLGFQPSGAGEHVFLKVEKRGRNTEEIARELSVLAAVPVRDVGYSGLKDRNAVTRQWFSVGLAGRSAPDWQKMELAGDVTILTANRHAKKLRRGSHSSNRFTIVLRQIQADRAALEKRLRQLREQGVPKYFGEQRFGRGGSTLSGAHSWMERGGRLSRTRRGLYLSALRANLFNDALGLRVENGSWRKVKKGDVCMLRGSRSFFVCDEVDADIEQRCATGDIAPGLPLWGSTGERESLKLAAAAAGIQSRHGAVCDFLEHKGVELSWRSARLLPDDFSWQFCDDDSLQLNFTLGVGCYATALLAEFVQYSDGSGMSGIGSE